jgi:hypothetical protein
MFDHPEKWKFELLNAEPRVRRNAKNLKGIMLPIATVRL